MERVVRGHRGFRSFRRMRIWYAYSPTQMVWNMMSGLREGLDICIESFAGCIV